MIAGPEYNLNPGNVLSEWSFEPGVVLPLAVMGFLYFRGDRRSGSVLPKQRCFFWSGWTVLTLALVSPLHELGEKLFSAHMTQHEVLMLVAAPLLVLARPLAPFLHGMPMEWRRGLGRWSKTRSISASWSYLTLPLSAWLFHAAALWFWHIPLLFDATLRNEWIHSAQHLSFFGSALFFWWSLFHARGANHYGKGVLYIFTTGLHTGILGALLALSSRPWYAAYANSAATWGLTPVEDQQLGGLIMWVPASLVYLGAGLALFAAWVRTSNAETTVRRYA